MTPEGYIERGQYELFWVSRGTLFPRIACSVYAVLSSDIPVLRGTSVAFAIIRAVILVNFFATKIK